MSQFKGVTVSDVLAEIRTNRRAIAFWTARKANNNFRISIPAEKRAEIVKSHNDNIRDLRIMAAVLRFPEFPADAFRFGSDFTPVIVASDDDNADNVETETETVSDADRAAIVAAMVDSVADATGETVNV